MSYNVQAAKTTMYLTFCAHLSKKYSICKFLSPFAWHRNAINMIYVLHMYSHTIFHLYMLTNCSCVYLLCIRCAHCQNLKFCINMIFHLYMTVYIYSFNNSVRRSSYLWLRAFYFVRQLLNAFWSYYPQFWCMMYA